MCSCSPCGAVSAAPISTNTRRARLSRRPSLIPLTGVTIPQIFGHEFSANVVEIGEGVTSVATGDRVSVMPLIFCGRCDQCRLGKHHMCRIMACTGLSSSSGGLAEYSLVHEYQVARLPDEVTDIQGAAIEPAVVAMYGVERAQVSCRWPGSDYRIRTDRRIGGPRRRRSRSR